MDLENKYLSKKDLEKIKNHKYQTTGYSKLDNYMNPFWVWCANLIPKSISANYVTIFGLLSQFSGVLLILFYDLSMKKDIPSFTYILFALFVFLGQTFDAIDGKHARNTNRCSPLGQLMDHGCDAFSNSFLAIMLCQAYLIGGSVYTIILQTVVQFAFFTAQWEENQTKIIKTHINDVGVTEYQFLTMILLIFPSIFGHILTDKSYLGGFISFVELFCLLNASWALYNSCNIISENLKNLTKDQLFDKIYPFFSLMILLIAEFLCLNLKAFENHSLLVVLLNGFFFGFQTSKLILCTMSDKKIEMVCYENILYFFCILLGLLADSLYAEIVILAISFAFLIYRYSEFIYLVTDSLLKFLNIEF